MNVLVCCKGISKGIRKIKLVEDKGTVECENTSFPMNECDEYALDAALVWKKDLGVNVTALTMGGSSESGYPLSGHGQRRRSGHTG